MAFDFSKFKIPGLFSQKAEPLIETNPETEQPEKISYRRFGFIQAGTMHGKTEGLKICLDAVYQQHMAEMRRDEKKQEELRKPFKVTLQELLGTNESLKSQMVMYEKEIIPSKKTRIEDLKKEIIDVRKNPEHYTGVHVGKAGFYIGAFILILLSIYLFIFYSSASYSAFFKEFKVIGKEIISFETTFGFLISRSQFIKSSTFTFQATSFSIRLNHHCFNSSNSSTIKGFVFE